MTEWKNSMNGLAEFIFTNIPYTELIVRGFFHRHPELKKRGMEWVHNSKRERVKKDKDEVWNNIKHAIIDLGIKKGDTLLVHSSTTDIFKYGISPMEIIDFLLELVGENGTLAFAAYPKCKYSEDEECFVYDPRKTPSITGLLPNIFMKYDGVVRSECPVKPIAVKGPMAEEMLRDNILCTISQGRFSAWDYMAKHRVKVLCLGVSAAESSTMINYVEGAMGEDWPITDWFCDQTYLVYRYSGEKTKITISVHNEDKGWYRFYKMFHMEKWLIKHGFLNKKIVDGIPVEITNDTSELAKRLLADAQKGKLFFEIPKKYWKNQHNRWI